jgi:chromosome segregation ATPase
MERFKERVEIKLQEIVDLLNDNKKSISLLTKKINTIMTALDSLQAAVERDTAVDTSAIALIKGIADQLKAAQGDPAAIAALTDKLTANADALAAAVAANTPATTTPAP